MHEVHYGERGKKILIIPGWLHTERVYVDIAKKLSAYQRVTVVDLPGFGSSANIDLCGENTIEAVTQHVREFLHNKFFDLIVTHSFSCSILLRILQDTDKMPCRRFILANPTYLGSERLRKFLQTNFFARTMKRLFELQAKAPRCVANPLTRLVAAGSSVAVSNDVVEGSRLANPLVASKLLTEVGGDTWRFAGSLPDEVEGRILVGEKDKVVPQAHIDILAKDLGRIPRDIIPNIGHVVILEAPERFYQYINGQLELL